MAWNSKPAAAAQSADNYVNQPFPAQPNHGMAPCKRPQSAHPEWEGSIDLVISNPPFSASKPKSPNAARNLARHDDTLSMGDMVKAAQAAQEKEGGCAPFGHRPTRRMERVGHWVWALPSNKPCNVTPCGTWPPKRVLSEWRKTERHQ